MIASHTSILALYLIVSFEDLNPLLNVDGVKPIVELAVEMDLGDYDFGLLFLHFLIFMSAVGFVFTDFVGFGRLIETATYTVYEL